MTDSVAAVRTEAGSGLLTVLLDRPDKRNAINAAMVEGLHRELERADLDPDVRVVLLRGAGEDFCAGADLEELLASADRGPAANEVEALRLGELFGRIRRLPKPVVAVVQGRALGGGAGLATACDLVLAGSGAQIGYPEVQRGFVPALVMTILRRLAGEKAAMELVLTGRVVGAEEARQLGLVSRVVADDALEREAGAVARSLAQLGSSPLALTKQLFYQLDTLPFDDGIRLGAQVNALARESPDFREAIARFLRR